jgi:beta-glucosidase
MQNAIYLDPDRPTAERVNDLISRMTLEEKVAQMQYDAPAIDRLNLPKYNWWNECLHGVGRAGIATVFPQAIGMAAAWDVDLIQRVADAIGNEGRAKHHEAVRQGIREIYTGLTFWTPNINIFRDPRWGRGQETYGEDPYLTARIGVTFVKGLQGSHPRYLKVTACAKHFAVHSGPESERHEFNAVVGERDLRDTYLFAFEALVREGQVEAVMGAYNRTNGEACCASPTLLQKILREEWGFEGHVVSDCWAIADIYAHHKLVATPEEAAALAVKAGCDLECGSTYPALVNAVHQGLIDEAALDVALRRLFTTRMRLGMFDPEELVPYTQIPFEVNDSPLHQSLALEIARESMVLLKNNNQILPLDKELKSIAVIGPHADWDEVLWGNYNGTPSQTVTPLEGIRAAVSLATKVSYAQGCGVTSRDTNGFEEAVELALKSDVVVMVLGLSQAVEGEEGQQEGVEAGEKSTGDRVGLDLPGVQEDLLKAVHAAGVPIVLVLINGSAISINWAAEHVDAILEAWYPGQAGGTAIADVLFGDYNPAGRLPVTFYKSLDQLPPFRDYNMAGRTYRYLSDAPLYPFGYGLSYTQFEYSDLQIVPEQIGTNDTVEISFEVTNTGALAGDEVVQLYVRDPESSVVRPLKELKGFARLYLQPGQSRTIHFRLAASQMSFFENGAHWLESGKIEVMVGASSADIRLRGELEIVGNKADVSAERVFFTDVLID